MKGREVRRYQGGTKAVEQFYLDGSIPAMAWVMKSRNIPDPLTLVLLSLRMELSI